MSFSVNEIFRKKLNEIQARVPVRIPGAGTAEDSFKVMLDAAVKKSSDPGVVGSDPGSMNGDIEANIRKAASKYKLDPNLIRAVIRQESNYNTRALSKAGAQGLMQIMPDTAKLLGLSDPWDIAQNIDGGSRYLRNQLDRFDGDARLALAAYNAGPDNVIKYGGIPPFAETKDYVTRVLEYYRGLTSAQIKK